MAKKKFRDLARVNPFDACGYSLYEEYKALLMNAVKITLLPAHIERFVKSCMIENNQVGFDCITRRWAIAFGEGVNEYWLPTTITFFFPNNKKSYQRPAYYEPAENGAYLVHALPTGTSFFEIISATTNEMRECDISIRQNLKATRTPFVAVVKDENTRLSLLSAIEQKEEGKPAVVTSADIAEGLKGVVFDTPYIVDKVEQYRTIIRDRLLNKLGIMSANINKRERVQVGEVNATVGQCVDYIYLWIDTFNAQMKDYGLPYRMELNGALEELYTEGEQNNDFERNNSVGVY
jgi:hypothetical protein